MERGKRICMTLKELRKRIADVNEIPYEIEECTHRGDCPGTCPRCESELRYLVDAINQRERDGRPIRIEGLMSENELRQAFSSAPNLPDEPAEFVTAGIPAPPKDIRLESDIMLGMTEAPLFDKYKFEIKILGILLSSSEKNINLIYSPAGLIRILHMLKEGIDERSNIHEAVCKLIGGCYGGIENENTKDFRLEHATSLWYNQRLGSVKEEYIEELADNYEIEVHSTDFADKIKTKQRIDKWVSNNTNRMIPVLDAELSENALLVLLDAIYMKGKWENPFNADDTYKDTFHNVDRTESVADMMYQYMEKPEYGETDEFQVINLPYKDSDYSMVVVKPKEGHSLKDVVRDFGWLDFEPIDDCELELMMPRFEFDNTLSFVETLKKLGLTDLFEAETSLSKITCEPAHISQIKQQCVIKVEEEGTEAAADTIAECEVGCPPPNDIPEPYKMRLDEPFAFAIKNRYGTVIFMGVVKKL